MELQQLRYFLETAKREHVTNSAKALRIAQPALTQTIRRLEKELGVSLFERTGRNVRLTPCGKALRDRVEPLLAALDDLPDELARIEGRERATVRLSIEAASELAVDAIAAYRADHPDAVFVVDQDGSAGRWDVRLQTHRVNSAHSARDMRDMRDTRDARGMRESREDHGGTEGTSSERSAPSEDEAPSAEGAGRDVPAGGARCYIERIGIAVPAGHASDGPLDLADLASESFICLAGSKALRRVCDQLCAEAGFAPRVAFESDNPLMVKKMIGLGLGVGFWPERSWGRLDDAEARLVPLADERFARAIEITAAPRPLAQEAAAFRGFLVRYFDEHWSEPSPLDGRTDLR